jgi:hypothetical protein
MAYSKFDTNESASQHRVHPSLTAKVEFELCKDCWKVATDLLAGSNAFDTHWQTIQSDPAILPYLKRHLDGTVGSLRKSAELGCGLCDLIAKQLLRLGELGSASIYHIFVWGRVSAKCEFKVALGDINRFTEHISKWQQPESLIFFRRNGASATLADVEGHGLLNNGGRPSLPVLADQDPGFREAFHRAQR